MNKGTFKGGIHPYEGKELSMNKPTVQLLPKGDLVYPMSQHIGAPAKPVVAVGDRVLMGQIIAEAGGFVSSPIAASVSGTVKEIRPTLTVSGAMANAIVIENDNKYEPIPGLGEKRDYTKLSKQEIRDIIADIPSYEELDSLYAAIGAKHTLEELGIDPAVKDDFLDISSAIRNRLTLARMTRLIAD